MYFYPLIDIRPSCMLVTDVVRQYASQMVETAQEADILLIGGGDGWMLDMMRQRYHKERPFFGYNCGTKGFLLNHNVPPLTDISWDMLDHVRADAVDVLMTTIDGRQLHGFFFNDITIGASVLDYFSFHIQYSDITITTQGTGLVISTPLGSTGYALNLGQPLIPLASNTWGMSGIGTAPFSYSFVQPQPINIRVEGRVPIKVGLDGYNDTYDNIREIHITPSQRWAELLFLHDISFAMKRSLLAEEKLGKIGAL